MNQKTFRDQLTVKNTVLGIQFLFVAFGATVLVPLLVGIDPSVALFTAGIGTLIFHLITRGKVPVFLGSSFAFIAPIIEATRLYGWPVTLSGIIAVGLVYPPSFVALVQSALLNQTKSFFSTIVKNEMMVYRQGRDAARDLATILKM